MNRASDLSDERSSLLPSQNRTLQSYSESSNSYSPPRKPQPSKAPWNEKIGHFFNHFWLFRIGYRCGYQRIHTTSMAEICWVSVCIAIFAVCIYLVAGSYYYGISNKLILGGGVALHSGLLTGIFFAFVIFLSLRYPFYWRWGLFTMGFDRQMIYHRYCAYLGCICCVLHILDQPFPAGFTSPKAITGWFMYGCCLLLLLFSCNFCRRKHYNDIFLYSHWIFIFGLIVFGWLHNAILIIYGTFIVAIDVLLRVFDNQFRSTKITNIKMLDYDRVFKIEFEKKYFRYKAGQYVFIRFPDLGFFEFHPISLSSYPGSGNTCSVHIKASVGGNWTDKLCTYMKMNEGKKEYYSNIKCQIEGPYGELILSRELWKYEHVVFIGGGIGVTPLDSLYNQLITDLMAGESSKKAKTKRIDFVFTTRSRSLITEFASRNRAWQIAAEEEQKHNELARVDTHINPLADMKNIRMKEIEEYHAAANTRRVIQGQIQMMREKDGGAQRESILLTADDVEIGRNKKRNLKFMKRDTSQSDGGLQVSDTESDTSNPDRGESSRVYADDLAVEELDICNSTHITRVSDSELRKTYRATYPFINFDRPNIRGVIYGAAGKTQSKSVCVITSGPQSMINDCIHWGAEIGVDVHYEIFDW